MLLVTCPDCEGKISQEADPCPKCGLPNAGLRSKEVQEVEKRKKEQEENFNSTVLAIGIIIIVIILIIVGIVKIVGLFH